MYFRFEPTATWGLAGMSSPARFASAFVFNNVMIFTASGSSL
jgi:hypothetical protein